MSEKFQRKYELEIGPPERVEYLPGGKRTVVPASNRTETIIIKNPFTLEFQITRKILSSHNLAHLRIYNLGETTRNSIYKDPQSPAVRRSITFKAGYSYPLPLVFSGNIDWSTSSRSQGSTEFISEIEAFDFAFPTKQSFSNWTLPQDSSASVTKLQVVKKLISDLKVYGLQEGYISPEGLEDVVYDKRTVSNWTWNTLIEETDGRCFVDLGRVHVMNREEYFDGIIKEISEKSGLLGSPKKSDIRVEAEMIFEPELQIGQKVELKTQSQKIFNRIYKISSLTHTGVISDTVSGSCITRVVLHSPKGQLKLVQLSS